MSFVSQLPGISTAAKHAFEFEYCVLNCSYIQETLYSYLANHTFRLTLTNSQNIMQTIIKCAFGQVIFLRNY